MLDLATARRDNLKRVLDSRFSGSYAELARALHRSTSQIYDMMTGGKSFGPKIARYIESTLQLPTGYLDEPHELAPALLRSGRRIPLVSFVQAGYPTETGDNCYDEWIEVSDSTSREAYALRIKGPSMEPEFHEGEIVIVDPTISAKPGDFVVARVANSPDNEATIKQYAVTGFDRNGLESFELRPLNPLFPTLSSKDHEIDLLGVVIECRRPYR